jgi:integrase
MPRYDLWQHPDNGRWYVTWTIGGRSHRATTRTTKRNEAQEFLATFILEHSRPEKANPDQIAVSTVLDNYWERHAHKRPAAEALKIRIRHLKKFFALGTVDTVNAHNLDRYKELCLSQGLAIGTINLHRSALRAALKQAVKYGELAVAPFVGSDREPDPNPNHLTREQVAAMLRACRTDHHRHLATFILLGIYTGARRTAILELTWDRVDLKAGIVDYRVPGVVYTRKRRAVTAIPARLIAHLRRLHKRSRSTHVIEYRGKPVKSVKRAFRHIAKAAKVPHATPHILKHTAVTLALRVTTTWVVSGMTATSPRTLERVYGKHMMMDIKAATEAVARNGRANSAKSPSKGKRRYAIKRRKIKGRDGGRDRD